MLTVDEALQLVEEHAHPLAPRRAPLGEAAGLVLAEDVASDVDSPPHDKAMMDGYAVASGDRAAVRQVIDEIAAGDVPRHAVTPGTAARIMTGAPLPEGADAVVPIEQTEAAGGDSVRLLQVDPPPGQHILALGTSVRAGDIVVRAGAVLRPIEIAILAEAGRALVTVRARPSVAVLPTGNELVSVGERPAPGQIRNSNGPLLLAAATAAGAAPLDLGVARDEHDDLVARIEQGLTADVLVLSGGVSAGKFDLVPQVMAELGVKLVFHKVALRPGRPLWFGVHDRDEHRVLVFGLPGNPVSSFVCFELFARPAIAALAGRGFVGLPTCAARLSHDYDHAAGRAACLPARLADAIASLGEGTPRLAGVEILPWHGSADLATLAQANGLVHLAAERVRLAAGTLVDVLVI